MAREMLARPEIILEPDIWVHLEDASINEAAIAKYMYKRGLAEPAIEGSKIWLHNTWDNNYGEYIHRGLILLSVPRILAPAKAGGSRTTELIRDFDPDDRFNYNLLYLIEHFIQEEEGRLGIIGRRALKGALSPPVIPWEELEASSAAWEYLEEVDFINITPGNVPHEALAVQSAPG